MRARSSRIGFSFAHDRSHLSNHLKSSAPVPRRIDFGMTPPVQTHPVQNHPRHPSQRSTLRIASVSYLNATPLIYGLDQEPDRELLLDVPAKLIDLLREGRADVALLPVIDYQR